MVIGGPDGFSPCFSRASWIFLNASTRVSNAESQFAEPLLYRIVFDARVTSSPNGSFGAVGGPGAGAGACAKAPGAANIPAVITTIRIHAARRANIGLSQYCRSIPWPGTIWLPGIADRHARPDWRGAA